MFSPFPLPFYLYPFAAASANQTIAMPKTKKGSKAEGVPAPKEPGNVESDPLPTSPPAPAYAKPQLPWEADVLSWMGQKENRFAAIESIRQRYLAENNTFLMTEAEWRITAEGFSRPFKPRAELMVQLMTSTLCRSGRRRGFLADNPIHFAAVLRWQKGSAAFEEMATMFENYICQLDMMPQLNAFFHAYGLIPNLKAIIPGVPHKLKHLTKGQLGRAIARMDLTMGNAAKSKCESKMKEAREQKTQARWGALGSLFTSQGQSAEADGLIASKLQAAAARAECASTGGGPSISLSDAALLATAAAAAAAAGEAQPVESDPEIETKKAGGRKRRTSAVVTLLDAGERSHFHVEESDSNLKRVAKLALLEGGFSANVMTSAEELALLWNDADFNGNGDLSMVEWQAYARDKFNALDNAAANRKAFFEAAIDKDEGSTKGAFSMPILNRSNFRLYLERCFEYNKVKYAFNHLDTSNDDRVDYEEYKLRRDVFFQILGLDPKLCKRQMSIKDEFEMMIARNESIVDGKMYLSKAQEQALAGKEKPYINFHGMAHFYRRHWMAICMGRTRNTCL